MKLAKGERKRKRKRKSKRKYEKSVEWKEEIGGGCRIIHGDVGRSV